MNVILTGLFCIMTIYIFAHGFYFAKEYNLLIMSELQPMYPELFPIAFGNEEETMMMAGGVGSAYKDYVEPVGYLSNFEKYIPEDLRRANESNRWFLQGGNLVYNGGAIGSPNLERATPECSTPTEFAAAIQANERLLVDMTSKYVADSARDTLPTKVRIQRRVVDNYMNSRASHDNFEIRDNQWLRNFEGSDSERLLLAHLATRSFITGAGYATPNGLRFGQKIEHTSDLNAYGFNNSAYRIATEINTGARLEIRCNDINISPWALRMRIGTSALFLTMLQTPLAGVLEKSLPSACRDQNLYIDNLQRFNKAPMNNNGQLQPSKNMYRALDFQQTMYELMAESLGDYIHISDEYEDIIFEGQRYCDAFRTVLKGGESLESLKDRSDIGAKFSRIAASIRSGRETGFTRTPNDIISQYWDLRYDLIEVAPGDTTPKVEYGYGYRLRDRKQFKMTIPKSAVENAYYNPPKTTRAFVRGTLIRQRLVDECSWAHADIATQEGPLAYLEGRTVRFPQVVISGLTRATDAIKYTSDLYPHNKLNT